VVGSFPSRERRFSRLIVLLCVILGIATVSQAQISTIIFFADRHVSEAIWQPLFFAVHEDLTRESYGLADHNPHLLRASEIHPGQEFGNVIEVKLLGRCDVPQQAYRPLKSGPLGWVLRVHGEIQPYIYVDCTRMAQTLNATTLGMSPEQRTRAMSQAIAHVLVHEWIHIATQNAEHTEHGITQAQLTPSTLIAEPDKAPISFGLNAIADEK
jgi:hypothetical protein